MNPNSYKNKSYYDNIVKVVASFLSALPEDQRRGAAAQSLNVVSESASQGELPREGSSLVFPVLAIPDDSSLSGVINLISGMGAAVLSLGQAKPSSTVRQVMDTADMMMGKSSVAFSGDPNSMGLPVASAIAAAASADPDIAADAKALGLNQIIAEVSALYDCCGHRGPLSMVDIPNEPTALSGGILDWVGGLFSGDDDSAADKLSDKANKKVDKATKKLEKKSDKLADAERELTTLESQLAATSDAKKRKKLQKKIDKQKKKIAKLKTKQSKLTDKISEWTDVADRLNGPDAPDAPVEDEDGPRQRGENILRDEDGISRIASAVKQLTDAGVPANLANVLCGYLIPQGIRDPLTYVTKLSASLELSLTEAVRYAIYVASGIPSNEALNMLNGGEAVPMDIEAYLTEAKAKNDAYRAALQRQMMQLRSVNEAAASASRMYVRSEWADAIMSSSDEVADWLQTVAPDASSTTTMLRSLASLLASARNQGSTSSFSRAVHQGVADGVLDPEAGYLLTGDPTMIPTLVVAVPSNPTFTISEDTESAQSEEEGASALKANPVVAAFEASL